MNSSALAQTARSLVAPGKGLLAADESFPTIGKRFAALKIDSTEANRRAYREMLFSTPAVGDFISGAILFDETLRQKSAAGRPFAELLLSQGILPGIKVDLGTTELTNFPGETITQGLDGLRERLREYYGLGARFTKWRAVLKIKNDLPSATCIDANAHALAMFAALSQEAGLVPIVEPEVLMDGDHSLDRTAEVTTATLDAVFKALDRHRVRLDEMLLKPAMVVPGADCAQPVSDGEIAARTLACLHRSVPAIVPGIVFLSGGQTPEQATQRLAAINRAGNAPWALTFSFGRALQDPALKAWEGNPAHVSAAQAALLERARENSQAVRPSAGEPKTVAAHPV